MTWGLRGKEMVAVLGLVLLIVVGTTALHMAYLVRLGISEARDKGQVLAGQIYYQSRQVISRGWPRPPEGLLREDLGLRSLLEASISYSTSVLYGAVTDGAGRVLIHSEQGREGTVLPDRASLESLVGRGVFGQLNALVAGEATYEARMPLDLDGESFGTVRVGISMALLRREIAGAAMRSLLLGGIALILGVLVALALARMVLGPLRAIREGVDRMAHGEYAIRLPLRPGDEFGDLALRLNTLGAQIESDRRVLLGEKVRFEHVVDGLNEAVILLNREGRILFCNQAGLAFLGAAEAEAVLHQPIADVLGSKHPLVTRIGRTAQKAQDQEVAIVGPGGGAEFVTWVHEVRDREGLAGTLIQLRNLKSVREIESLFTQSQELATLGQLTSGVAHEVKNPLHAMTVHVELLKGKLGKPRADIQKHLGILGGEIRRLDRVVQGFLKFVRPQQMERRLVDLHSLLDSLAAVAEVEWGERGIRLHRQFRDGTATVRGDPELLQQAFLNLVRNGCEAMPTGGQLSITTVRQGEEHLEVVVADQGVGIEPRDAERVGQLYFSTKPEGYGIGLAQVYRIVRMHEGTVDFASVRGEGTRVTVRLPAA